MKKVSMFAAFALSFSLAASLLVLQAEAWNSPLPLWEKEWAGGSLESASDVAVAADGSVYTVGYTRNFSTGGGADIDALILKYSRSGSLLWAKTWGGMLRDEAFGVAYVPRGEYICVVGRTWSFGNGSSDAFILLFGSGGNLVWERTWGGPSFDEAVDVAVHAASCYIYVVGRTLSFGVNCDAFTLCFFPNGVLSRQLTWGGSSTDVATALAVANNGIYVVGYTCSFLGFPWIYDAFIVKLAPMSLTPLWEQTWGGVSDEAAHGVAVDSSGRYIYVVGMTRSYTPPVGDFEAFILQLDSTGALLWRRTWGGPNADTAVGVAVMDKTDIYVVGEAWSFSPTPVRPSAFALHVNSTGSLIDEVAWAGSSAVVSATDVAVGPKPLTGPYIYISGYARCSAPFSYLTLVGGNFVHIVGAPVSVTGNVTPLGVATGAPRGNVQTPTGSQTYLPWQDATLICIWP